MVLVRLGLDSLKNWLQLDNKYNMYSMYVCMYVCTVCMYEFVNSCMCVGKLADLVLWQPAFFGAKPEMILKGGHIAWAQVESHDILILFA